MQPNSFIKVRGIVKDDKTNQMIVGAVITLNDSNITVTNSKGLFELKINYISKALIQVSMLGYKTEIKEVLIEKDEREIEIE